MLAAGRQFRSGFASELGYMSQYLRREGATDRVIHLVVLNLKYRY